MPAITDGRLAYQSYTAYGTDGELHVWDFPAGAADMRAEQAVNSRVQYAMNPQFSGNGRYLVLMGVDRQLSQAWPNLDIFIYDFRSDTVTNLSEALISAGFLPAGSDWIDEDPSFYPTSLTIAFKRRSGGSSDLWSLKLDGTAQTPIALTRLTNTPGVEESGPKFSPDGQTIVCWIGSGASSWIASLPAAGGTVALVVDNANKQDYYPSYWQDDRILYTSWDTNGSGDDDIRYRDLTSGADSFGLGGFHSAAEDSDAFAISPTLVGFSSSSGSADNKWRLWYGDPTTGAVQAFPFHTADKHDLGGSYTPHFVCYVPGPERSELPGDYNFNYVVDAADFTVWRNTLGSTVDLRADGSGPAAGTPDGVVDQYDYDFWKANFGKMIGVGGGASADNAHPGSFPAEERGQAVEAARRNVAQLDGPRAGITLFAFESLHAPAKSIGRSRAQESSRSVLSDALSEALIHRLAISKTRNESNITTRPPTLDDAANASGEFRAAYDCALELSADLRLPSP